MSGDNAARRWRSLRLELADSLNRIVGDPTAILHLIVAMILGGAAGIWVPVLAMGKPIGADAIAAYVFAVLAPLIADLLIDADALVKKLNRESRIFVLFCCVFASCLALIALLRGDDGWYAGISGSAVAIFVWMVVMGKTDRFRSDNPSNPIGGESAAASNLSGSGLQ